MALSVIRWNVSPLAISWQLINRPTRMPLKFDSWRHPAMFSRQSSADAEMPKATWQSVTKWDTFCEWEIKIGSLQLLKRPEVVFTNIQITRWALELKIPCKLSQFRSNSATLSVTPIWQTPIPMSTCGPIPITLTTHHKSNILSTDRYIVMTRGVNVYNVFYTCKRGF